MTKIIAGSNSKELAYELSKQLNSGYIDATVERFADQELRIQLPMQFYEENVIIVQSTYKPANDHLMELLLLVDAAKRAGAHRVAAIVPYFCYSRQDRSAYDWGPISARLVAIMMEAAGIDHLITLDLHSKQAEGFFKIVVQNIESSELFASVIDKDLDLIVVSPDIGGLIKARKFAGILSCKLAAINKSHNEHNLCDMDLIIGNVSSKDCIIVDDIVDTGRTLCRAASLLKEYGANSIQVVVTHPVLSGDAIDKLKQAPIDQIITTDSIPQNLPIDKFKIINIAPIISESVKRLMKSS